MKIDRQQIVDAALDIIEETGIDGLTTRLIAQRLGVQQPALYWHFRNKRALLDAMNHTMLERGHRRLAPLPGEVWPDFLREVAMSFRSALLSVRDGARIHAGTEADPGDLEQIEAHMGPLVAAGMTPARAMEVHVAVSRYVVGCVLEEQAERDIAPDRTTLDDAAAAWPIVSAALASYRQGGHDAMFRAGLEMLIAGIVHLTPDRPTA